MISLENVHKCIDASQLTSDLEGTLVYDHEEWIQLRMVSKSFTIVKYHVKKDLGACHTIGLLPEPRNLKEGTGSLFDPLVMLWGGGHNDRHVWR